MTNNAENEKCDNEAESDLDFIFSIPSKEGREGE